MPDEYLDGLDPAKRAAAWSKNAADSQRVVLVASDAEDVVGVCSLLPSRDGDAGSDVAEITAIYVEPKRFRSGIGRALVERALDAARARAFREVTLWVLDTNDGARAFYEECGFRSDGGEKDEKIADFSIRVLRFRVRL